MIASCDGQKITKAARKIVKPLYWWVQAYLTPFEV